MRTLLYTAFLVVGATAVASATPKNPDFTETVIVYRNTQFFFEIPGWPDDGLYAMADVHIHQDPARGQLKVDLNERSFVFYPDIDLCAAADEFIYTLKYGDWMESYRIKLEIVCDAPTIMASFSPEGKDNQYRTFTVLGVQNFPGNTLTIFDRQGQPILKQSDYKNTWGGLLPDGSVAKSEDEFLYVFDDGAGNLYSGYIRVW